MTVLAQKEQATSLPPLVYEQENTGSHYPKPELPDAGLLPEIIELPNALQGVSSFSDWERRRHEIGTLIQHYGIGEKPVARGAGVYRQVSVGKELNISRFAIIDN